MSCCFFILSCGAEKSLSLSLFLSAIVSLRVSAKTMMQILYLLFSNVTIQTQFPLLQWSVSGDKSLAEGIVSISHISLPPERLKIPIV